MVIKGPSGSKSGGCLNTVGAHRCPGNPHSLTSRENQNTETRKACWLRALLEAELLPEDKNTQNQKTKPTLKTAYHLLIGYFCI